MARSFAEIQQELSELSPEQRAKLALALVESLEPEDEGDIAEAWRLEVEQRYERYKRGEIRSIPGDEVFAEAAQFYERAEHGLGTAFTH